MLQFHDNYETFATMLRAIRKKAHKTQQDLADETGIPRTRICEWERALRLPSYGSYQRLIAALSRCSESDSILALDTHYSKATRKSA